MGEIREEYREYALVDRMSDLLKNPPKTYFEETFCYSVFSSIIPWVCQRVRSEEFRFILEQLKNTEFPEELAVYFRMNDGFAIPSAGDALVHIRDAISHADARRVFPINEHGNLRGFKWLLHKNQGKVEIGKLSMRTIGIKKMGTFYADNFCETLRRKFKDESDEHFFEKVNDSLKEAA